MILLLKLLAIPLYPLGFSLVLVAIGLVLIYLRRRGGPLAIGIGAVFLLCMSIPCVTRLLIRPLETPYYAQTVFPEDCSAIVVLGGCGEPTTPPRVYPEITDAGDRLLHAARLYKKGLAPRVITTGGLNIGTLHQKMSEGEHNALLLQEIGVDRSAIIIERNSRTTADHGPFIAAILDSMKVPKKIILVTSAAHMYRSVAVFKKSGYTVYPAATDFHSSRFFFDGIRDLMPGAEALNDVTAAFHEYYGILGYKVMGKI